MFKCKTCDKPAYKLKYHYDNHMKTHTVISQQQTMTKQSQEQQTIQEFCFENVDQHIDQCEEQKQETYITIQNSVYSDKAKQLIQEYCDKDYKDFITFFKKFSQIIGIDLNYKRVKDNSFQYNAQAILMFDQSFRNRFIPLVLEIDFDAFYPNTLLNIKNIDENVQKLIHTLQQYRQFYKENDLVKYEKTVKFLQCAFIGCLGSKKESCKVLTDLYTHSLIMESSRQTFMKLVKIFEKNNKYAFFKQTDACFCVIDDESEIQQIFTDAQKLFPCKFKIHRQFYHFKQMNKYVSLVNEQPHFKGFARDCDWFGQYIYQFITKQDPEQFLLAYQDQRILENEPLIDALSRTVQQFPELLLKLNDKILIRIDHLDKNDYIKRCCLFINPKEINQVCDFYKKKYNNVVSFHEVMIRDTNSLIFDIDIAQDVDIEQIIDKLRVFVNNHQLICQLFEIPRCYVAYYKTQNKTSAHIKFDIQLPLQIQKEIALQCKNKICQDIDVQIYAISKSLRIPKCSNIKLKLTKEEMLKQQFQLYSSDKLEDYLFTTTYQQQIKDQYLFNCITKYQHTFPYTYDFIIENQDQIKSLLTQQLSMYNIIINNVIFTRDNFGEIHIQDNEQDCVICRRIHDNQANRIRLRFVITYNNRLRIACFQFSENPQKIEITIDECSIRRNIQLLDDPLENATIINQRFILNNKTDKYHLPAYQIDIIRSQMGSGKSELFNQIFDKYKKVLLVSTRKVFTLQNIKRFQLNDENIYWNQSNINNSVVCQVESLGKINENVIYECIILDEFMSILQQLYRENKVQSLEYCQRLINLIQRCERVIVSDATINSAVVNFFINCFNKFKINTIDNQFQIYTNNQVKIYTNYKQKDSLNYITQTIVNRYNNKQKTWAIISQRSEGILVRDQVLKQIPNARIKVFNGDQDSTDVDKSYIQNNQQRQIVNNIKLFKDENAFDDIDIVICNASITSGLNVTDQKFDFVICNIQTDQFSPQNLVQALHRTRYVKNIELFSRSLQTQFHKTTFYDSYLQGLSKDSYYTLNYSAEKLYSLSKQYIDDLNTTGLQYVIYQLQQMGYQILQESNFVYEQQEETKQQIEENEMQLDVQIVENQTLNLFMKFIPNFKTNNNLLKAVLNKFKNYQREDESLFKSFLNLSRYQIFAQKNTDGYKEMFEERDFQYNPALFTDVLKAYIVNRGDLNIDFEQYESQNDQEFEKLLLFIIQYTKIIECHGKQFLKDFLYNTHHNYKISTELRKFIQSDDFKDKKQRYMFYRENLQIEHQQELLTEKLIDLIVKDNLLQYNVDQLSNILEKDKYNDFSKSKVKICKYLGFHALIKQVRIDKQRVYKLFIYDCNYIPIDKQVQDQEIGE